MNVSASPHVKALLLLTPIILLLAGAAGAWAQESKNQQECIAALNGTLKKVARAQWDNTLKCVGDAAAGRLSGSVDDCVAGDATGKLAKLRNTLATQLGAKCTTLPDFGPTDGDTIFSSATESIDRTVQGLFGSPLDSAVITGATDAKAAACQTALAKAVRNCQNTVLQVFNTCKAQALKGSNGAAVTTAQQLQERCLGPDDMGIADPQGKIAKACDATTGALAKTATRSCFTRGVDLATAIHGFAESAHTPTDGADLGASVGRLAKCQVCQALNEADALDRDCDLADNAVDDSSCANTAVPLLQVSVTTAQPIYAPGQMVSANVSVTSAFAIPNGSMTVTAYDAASASNPQSFLTDQTLPLTVAAGGTTDVPVQFPASEQGVFLLRAQVPTQRMVGEGLRKFGIRAALTGVPDTILRAQNSNIALSTVQARLEASANSGAPVTVTLGSDQFTLQVGHTTALQLDAGQPMPSTLAGMQAYDGSLCAAGDTTACHTQSASSVIFVVDPQTGALFGMVMEEPGNVLWIEPASVYDASASPTAHLLYRNADLVPPPIGHLEPPIPTSTMGSTAAGLLGAPRADSQIYPCPTSQDLHVKVRANIFESSAAFNGSAGTDARIRTGKRYLIVLSWRAVVRREFVRIPPRTAFSTLTVDDVFVTGWQYLDPGKYTGTCNAVLTSFTMEHDSSLGANNILFTPNGTGCDGLGFLNHFPGSPIHINSLVRDVHDLDWATIALGQEAGHNWDYHDPWRPLSPHDPHLCPCISQSWVDEQNHLHGTIMNASYVAGAITDLTFSHNNVEPLQHLAEGICRYFADTPTPTRTSTPTVTPTPKPTATPKPLPDLTIVSVDSIDDVSDNGCQIVFTARNQGGSDATSLIQVTGLGTTLSGAQVLAIPAGKSVQGSVTLGTYCNGFSSSITVTADPSNFVSESNEKNNSLTVQLLPDLVVVSVDSVLPSGGNCTVTFTQRNQGLRDAGGGSAVTRVLGMSANVQVSEDIPFSGLGAGQPLQQSALLQGLPCTMVTLTITADATNKVAESNEANNTLTGVFAASTPTPAVGCGNHICESGENANNCPGDCAPVCGNGVCESGEQCSACGVSCCCSDCACPPGFTSSCPVSSPICIGSPGAQSCN